MGERSGKREGPAVRLQASLHTGCSSGGKPASSDPRRRTARPNQKGGGSREAPGKEKEPQSLPTPTFSPPARRSPTHKEAAQTASKPG